MFDAPSPAFRSDDGEWRSVPDHVQRAARTDSDAAYQLMDMPHRPSGDESRCYHSPHRARWIGWAITLTLYALIGSSGIFLTFAMHRPPMKQAPALTIIQPRPQQPAPPSRQPSEKVDHARKAPPTMPMPALPDIPSPLLLPPVFPDLPPAYHETDSQTDRAPAHPSSAQAVGQESADSWEGRILAALSERRRYPRTAIARHEEGVPIIRIMMNRQGDILSSRLDRSSGHAELDREAVTLPRRAAPLPPPPDDRPGETLELIVPVEFYLR